MEPVCPVPSASFASRTVAETNIRQLSDCWGVWFWSEGVEIDWLTSWLVSLHLGQVLWKDQEHPSTWRRVVCVFGA